MVYTAAPISPNLKESRMTVDPSVRLLVAAGLLSAALAIGWSPPSNSAGTPPAGPASAAASPAAAQEKGGQEEFGPYEPVRDWPKPVPAGAGGGGNERASRGG